ncbi:hypothetical protein D3C80_1372250 [compost metagenome]
MIQVGSLTTAALWACVMPVSGTEHGSMLGQHAQLQHAYVYAQNVVRQPAKALVHSQSGETAMAGIAAKIAKLALMPFDWDGHGGIAPAQATISEAIRFYEVIRGVAPPTDVEASPDGEINLVWRSNDGVYIEVGFDGDGLASYLVKGPNLAGPEYGDFAANELPTNLKAHMVTLQQHALYYM